jgi:hypothetical protein
MQRGAAGTMTSTPVARKSSASSLLALLRLRLLFSAALVAISTQQSAIAQPPAAPRPITLPGCPDKCGDVSIPYPFGTQAGCFLPGFEIVCNDTFRPPRPFLANPNLDKSKPVLWFNDYCSGYSGCSSSATVFKPIELIDASPPLGQARVYAAFSFDCTASDNTVSWSRTQLIDTSDTSPFILSRSGNVLVGVGRRVQANLLGAWPGTTYGADDGYLAQCASVVNPAAVPTDGAPCTSVGCCQSDMPPDLRCSRINISLPSNGAMTTSPCSYAMLVQKSWYNFSTSDLRDDGFLKRNVERGIPVVLDFAIRNDDGSCPTGGAPLPPACRSGNSVCANATNGPGYICKCKDGYDGNAYIPDGCQGISYPRFSFNFLLIGNNTLIHHA